jgi:hypothetical protein
MRQMRGTRDVVFHHDATMLTRDGHLTACVLLRLMMKQARSVAAPSRGIIGESHRWNPLEAWPRTRSHEHMTLRRILSSGM